MCLSKCCNIFFKKLFSFIQLCFFDAVLPVIIHLELLFYGWRLFPGLKRPGREAYHSSPSSTEVKNGGAIPLLSHMSSWRSVQLIKHRVNFISVLLLLYYRLAQNIILRPVDTFLDLDCVRCVRREIFMASSLLLMHKITWGRVREGRELNTWRLIWQGYKF
jgi:hypothetical protein